MNEATARIKINRLLEAAGWRFFADADQPANIQLEPSVTIMGKKQEREFRRVACASMTCDSLRYGSRSQVCMRSGCHVSGF